MKSNVPPPGSGTIICTTLTETNQTNREKVKRGFGGRNFVLYVAGIILLWNYVICPVLDLLGYTMFLLPLSEIFKLLAMLLTG